MASPAECLPEWCEWAAVSGPLILSDGRTVIVRGGDQILVEDRGRYIVILDHRPVARH